MEQVKELTYDLLLPVGSISLQIDSLPLTLETLASLISTNQLNRYELYVLADGQYGDLGPGNRWTGLIGGLQRGVSLHSFNHRELSVTPNEEELDE
ncbi:hypothetical protein D915_005799 [Fasciola hepatica]|uniref:Ionotropic glutamate receptor L-glutamate and glycine-binding domain-containing protein n=1 Tax=Fasciola hepatica TaxID=6192 RepID=A0A4E0R4X6_FASHE|nr:hypothetical protein D915_005799 [Fasciola hepatica]